MCYIFVVSVWIHDHNVLTFVSIEYKSSSTFKCTKSLSLQNLCTLLFLICSWVYSSIFVKHFLFFNPNNFLFKIGVSFSGVEAIVVVLHDSLISDCFIKIVGFFFLNEWLDKREIVIQCPYFTCTLTAHTFGVIIVLHKTELWKAAQLRKRFPASWTFFQSQCFDQYSRIVH